jgi:hypothetical protein
MRQIGHNVEMHYAQRLRYVRGVDAHCCLPLVTDPMLGQLESFVDYAAKAASTR